ncbi:MAG: hypothetical protein K5655_03915 [Lachnospiraceae bacterium]|nr:hypothetical protein [Lachnospiraceae bacterium]
MRIEKELTRSNKRAAEDKKAKRRRDDAPEDDTIEYKPHEWHYLNEGSGVFSSVMDNGINTQESVFDKYAVFKTRKREDNY